MQGCVVGHIVCCTADRFVADRLGHKDSHCAPVDRD